LFFGGDLPNNDDFTLQLLTNKEVLKMHRESEAVRQLFKNDEALAITSKSTTSDDIYLAIFNISDNSSPITIEVNFDDLGLNGSVKINKLWTGEEVGEYANVFSQKLSAHESGLFRMVKQ
jgi:alpha-galactosidase